MDELCGFMPILCCSHSAEFLTSVLIVSAKRESSKVEERSTKEKMRKYLIKRERTVKKVLKS